MAKPSAAAIACLLPLLLLLVSVAESVVIIVGGSTGWTTGFNYDAWAAAQNIQPRVGDSLVFKNPDSMTHTVAMLSSQDAYDRCILGGALQTTPIAPGTNVTIVIPAALQDMTVYAVCTIPGHCTDSQKIKGLVLPKLSTNGTSPPGAGTPPSPPSAPGTTPANDADMNRLICWTTAILLIVACFWNLN